MYEIEMRAMDIIEELCESLGGDVIIDKSSKTFICKTEDEEDFLTMMRIAKAYRPDIVKELKNNPDFDMIEIALEQRDGDEDWKTSFFIDDVGEEDIEVEAKKFITTDDMLFEDEEWENVPSDVVDEMFRKVFSLEHSPYKPPHYLSDVIDCHVNSDHEMYFAVCRANYNSEKKRVSPNWRVVKQIWDGIDKGLEKVNDEFYSIMSPP